DGRAHQQGIPAPTVETDPHPLGNPKQVQKRRHIFVEERSGPEAATGLADTGPTMAIRNARRTWQAKYDISYHAREVQLAMSWLGQELFGDSTLSSHQGIHG
ncbi:hypothetical protein N2152v2_008676, partial [Parachlorella kessleri]